MSKEKIERLKQIKEQLKALYEEESQIEAELDNCVIYLNEDNTWTRFTKIDNIEELKKNSSIFRVSSIGRFTTKIENLKNPPKELKSLND